MGLIQWKRQPKRGWHTEYVGTGGYMIDNWPGTGEFRHGKYRVMFRSEVFASAHRLADAKQKAEEHAAKRAEAVV